LAQFLLDQFLQLAGSFLDGWKIISLGARPLDYDAAQTISQLLIRTQPVKIFLDVVVSHIYPAT